MSKAYIICNECGKRTNEGHTRRKYCNDCYEKLLYEEINMKSGRYYLLPNVFNKKSKFSTKYYAIYLKEKGIVDWVDVIRYYNLETEFTSQISDLLILGSKKYINKSVTEIIKILGFNLGLFSKLDYNTIENITGLIIKKHNVTIEDLKTDFMRIKSNLGYIPLYSEFFKLSRHNEATCGKLLNSNNKNVYDKMVKTFSDEKEFDEYSKRKYNKKIINIKKANISNSYTNSQLKENLIFVCNDYYNLNGFYPSSRVFDNISNIDSSTYRKRHNCSFVKIIENTFGITPKVKWKSERECLNLVASVLEERYEPQKTFNWLVSNYGGKMMCDGYFPKSNIVVEYHGKLHREPLDIFGGEKAFIKRQDNDFRKLELLKKYGINPIVIWFDDDWRNLDWLQNKLKENNI